MTTATANSKTSNHFPLIVRSRQKILFQGEVTAISSTNDKGNFDVLPGHANFITLIKKQIALSPTTGEKQQIEIDNGVLRIFKNTASIYIGVT